MKELRGKRLPTHADAQVCANRDSPCDGCARSSEEEQKPAEEAETSHAMTNVESQMTKEDGRSKPAHVDDLPRWREGPGVGLFSPKAMNNKTQGRFSAPWGGDRCRQINLNEVLQRMCAIPLHTIACRLVVQPLRGCVNLDQPRQRVPIFQLPTSISQLYRRARALPLPP